MARGDLTIQGQIVSVNPPVVIMPLGGRHKIAIKTSFGKPHETVITVDGKELRGVTGIEFYQRVEGVPRLVIEMFADVEIEAAEAEVHER